MQQVKGGNFILVERVNFKMEKRVKKNYRKGSIYNGFSILTISSKFYLQLDFVCLERQFNDQFGVRITNVFEKSYCSSVGSEEQ